MLARFFPLVCPQVEHDERVSEDEQIVNALNDYTQALQDGLRLINQQ